MRNRRDDYLKQRIRDGSRRLTDVESEIERLTAEIERIDAALAVLRSKEKLN
jgi:prefoldin subunit 5